MSTHTWTCDRCGDIYQTRDYDHLIEWIAYHARTCTAVDGAE